MAGKKANGASKSKEKPASKRGKKDDDAPKMGHNIKITKSAISDYAKRYNALLDEKETRAGELMSDVKFLIEDAAGKLGLKRALLRQALKEQRADRKQQAAEKEMEPDDAATLDKLREALGLFSDTPLGIAAMDRLPPTPSKLIPKASETTEA